MTQFHAAKHNSTSAFGPSACQRTSLDLHLCSVLHQKAYLDRKLVWICYAINVHASLQGHISDKILEVNDNQDAIKSMHH